MEYYSAIEKDEILPSGTMWLDLEGITLNEISQTKKDKYRMISLMWSIRNKNKVSEQTKHAATETEWWLPEGKGWWGRGVGEMGEGDQLYDDTWKLKFWW